MSASRPTVYLADARGLTVPVIRPLPIKDAAYGIAIGTHFGGDGEPMLAVTVRAADGAMLTAVLADRQLDTFAHMIAAWVEASTPAIHRSVQ